MAQAEIISLKAQIDRSRDNLEAEIEAEQKDRKNAPADTKYLSGEMTQGIRDFLYKETTTGKTNLDIILNHMDESEDVDAFFITGNRKSISIDEELPPHFQHVWKGLAACVDKVVRPHLRQALQLSTQDAIILMGLSSHAQSSPAQAKHIDLERWETQVNMYLARGCIQISPGMWTFLPRVHSCDI